MFPDAAARLPAFRDASDARRLAAWFRRRAQELEERARLLERDAFRALELAAWAKRRDAELAALPDQELPPDLRRARRRRRLEARNAAIMRDVARGWTNARLQERYGLHPSTLSRIVQSSLESGRHDQSARE